MRRDSIKHWNVSFTREELDVARKVFADYVTERLGHNLEKSDILWLREVDRVGRKLQHTGPR
jgi:hypothetical protein